MSCRLPRPPKFQLELDIGLVIGLAKSEAFFWGDTSGLSKVDPSPIRHWGSHSTRPGEASKLVLANSGCDNKPWSAKACETREKHAKHGEASKISRHPFFEYGLMYFDPLEVSG